MMCKNLVNYISYGYLTPSLLSRSEINIGNKFFILDLALIMSFEYQLASNVYR